MFRAKGFRVVVLTMLAVAAGIFTSAKAAGTMPDISGNYTCQGTNPGTTSGPGYRGITTISKVGNTFLMGWTISGTSYTGVGLRNGNILSVAWYSAGQTGVVAYQISPDGRTLKGTWAGVGGTGLIGYETLTR